MFQFLKEVSMACEFKFYRSKVWIDDNGVHLTCKFRIFREVLDPHFCWDGYTFALFSDFEYQAKEDHPILEKDDQR